MGAPLGRSSTTWFWSVVVPAVFVEKTADISRFDSIRGNVGALVGTLVVVWLTAAFAEEVIFRGFLMGRLARLFGGSRLAWTASLLISSVLFGALHLYQGPAGVLGTGTAGLVLGLIYLVSGRNLWVCILTHGITDSISLVLIFLSTA